MNPQYTTSGDVDVVILRSIVVENMEVAAGIIFGKHLFSGSTGGAPHPSTGGGGGGGAPNQNHRRRRRGLFVGGGGAAAASAYGQCGYANV